MIEKLVWLFEEHHDAVSEIQRQRGIIVQLEAALADAERRAADPRGSVETLDMLKKYQEEWLSDRPYDGPVPDEVWLSPGENDRRSDAL